VVFGLDDECRVNEISEINTEFHLSSSSDLSQITPFFSTNPHFLLTPYAHSRYGSWLDLAWKLTESGFRVSLLLPTSKEFSNGILNEFNRTFHNRDKLTLHFLHLESSTTEYVIRNLAKDTYGFLSHFMIPLSLLIQFRKFREVYDPLFNPMETQNILISDPMNWPAIAIARSHTIPIFFFLTNLSPTFIGLTHNQLFTTLSLNQSLLSSMKNTALGIFQRTIMFPLCLLSVIIFPNHYSLSFYDSLTLSQLMTTIPPPLLFPNQQSYSSLKIIYTNPNWHRTDSLLNSNSVIQWIETQKITKKYFVFVRLHEMFHLSPKGSLLPLTKLQKILKGIKEAMGMLLLYSVER
jgi:hypothetical protein